MPSKKSKSLLPLPEAEARFAGWLAFQDDNGGCSLAEKAKARGACALSPLSFRDLEDKKELLRKRRVDDDYIKGKLERLASGELEVQITDELRRHAAREFERDVDMAPVLASGNVSPVSF